MGSGGGITVMIPNHNTVSITFRRGKDFLSFILCSQLVYCEGALCVTNTNIIGVIFFLIIELHYLHAKYLKKVLLVCIFNSFKDNSLKEWSFKSAITVQTYNGYDPIPVPFNIIYSVAKLLRIVREKKKEKVRVNKDEAVVRASPSTNAAGVRFWPGAI